MRESKPGAQPAVFRKSYPAGVWETHCSCSTVPKNRMLSPETLLRILQDCAAGQAEQLGYGRESLLRSCGGVWMLNRLELQCDAPVSAADVLSVTTWTRPNPDASCCRDFLLETERGIIGKGTTIWSVVHLREREILRMKAIPEIAGAPCRTVENAEILKKRKLPQDLPAVGTRTVRPEETDENGHMNNACYARCAVDAAELSRVPDRFVRELYLHFARECMAGETLVLFHAAEGNRHFVRGEDRSAQCRFEAVIRTEAVP